VTHQPDLVQRLGGTLLYLVKGRVEASASLDGSAAALAIRGSRPSSPASCRRRRPTPVSAPATVIDLSYWQVGVALVLVAVVIVISIRQSLGSSAISPRHLRTIVQLYASASSWPRCSLRPAGTGSCSSWSP